MSLFFGVASVSVMLPDFGSHNNNAVVVVYLDSFETYLKALILQVSSSATLASSTCCLLLRWAKRTNKDSIVITSLVY